MSNITPGVSSLAAMFPSGTPLVLAKHGDTEVTAHSTGNVVDAATPADVRRLVQADWQGARFITNGDETGSAVVTQGGQSAVVELDHPLRFAVPHTTQFGTTTHMRSPESWAPLNDAVKGVFDAKGLPLIERMPDQVVPDVVVPDVVDDVVDTAGGGHRSGKLGLAVGLGAAVAGAAGLGIWLAQRD